MHSPTTVHWNGIKRILRYLKSTISHGISFQDSSDLSLTCFIDVDWASCPDDRKSTSGYCCFPGSDLISWSSSKQRVVSRSSAELEYRGLANAAAELIWVEALLAELHLSLPSPAALLCDNISATQLAANPILHVQTNHIEIDFHFIRERVVNKSVEVYFTPSQEQLADIMTKPLPAQRSQSLRNRMTVLHNPISLRG